MKKIILLLVILLLSSCESVENTQQKHSTDITADAEILQNAEQSDEDVNKAGDTDGNIYEEVIFPFVSGDGYGKLLPYIGEFRDTPATPMSYETSSCKYGLCTLDGRIVVNALDDVISDITYYNSADNFNYLVVSVGKVEDGSYDGYHPQRTYVIPQSGKWCIELEEGVWSFTDGFGGICASYAAEKEFEGMTYDFYSKSLLYDYNGNYIREFGQSTAVYNSDGCLSMTLFDESPYGSDSKTVCFDKDGVAIEHMHKSGCEFNEYGVRIASDEYGFILENDKGHMLTETSFSELEYISNESGTNGLFVAKMRVTNDLYQYFFFSKDASAVSSGNDVYSKYDIELFFPDSGDIICKYLADDGVIDNVAVFLNLTDKRIIYEDHSGKFLYNESNDNVIVADGRTYGGGVGMVFDYDGNELLRVDDLYLFNDASENGRFVIYTSCANYYDLWGEAYTLEKDERKTFIYDIKEGRALHSFHGLSTADFIGNDDRFVRYFNYTAEEGGNAYNYGLYDTKNRELVVANAENIQHYSASTNDYFAVSYKNKSALYNSEMNEIITTYYE